MTGVPDEIPTLDLAAFRDDPGSRPARRFVAELRGVGHEHGFFQLTGHGIDPDLNRRVQALARQFFALPEAERLAIASVNSPQFRGYTPIGHEYTGNRPDQRDELDVGRELPAPTLGANDPAWLRLRGPNQWPQALPELRPALEEWIDAMEHVGRTVARGLALALGQPGSAFDAMVRPHPEVLVKVIRYPGVVDGDRQGVGEHRDTGLLTFVLQDACGGLQVGLDGTWVDVAPQADAFVVNLGEMMQLLTSGYFAATVHRVVSPTAPSERLSLAYFFNPKLEATLRPFMLPAELAAQARGGESTDPDNPILANYGDNSLKVRLRAHPDVARRHHADLLG